MDVQRRPYLEAALAAAAGSSMARAQADDGKLETTQQRLAKLRSICLAPQYVAEALLRSEGFTEIEYVAGRPGVQGLQPEYTRQAIADLRYPQLARVQPRGDRALLRAAAA